MDNDDLQQRVTEIETLIASNQLNKSVKRLMDFSKDFSFDRERQRRAISIKGEYNSLRESEIGYGKTDDLNRKFSKLRDDILEVTDLIKNEFDDLYFIEDEAEDKTIDISQDPVTKDKIAKVKSLKKPIGETEF